jgi:hypothetical protein
MNCFECNRPAHGICKFCGRGVCKDHLQERVHIVSVFNGENEKAKALVTKGALYCGKCKPVGDPVDLDDKS